MTQKIISLSHLSPPSTNHMIMLICKFNCSLIFFLNDDNTIPGKSFFLFSLLFLQLIFQIRFTTVLHMEGKKNKRLGQERETRPGLETHLHLELQVCFFFSNFFYYTNNYLHTDRLHVRQVLPQHPTAIMTTTTATSTAIIIINIPITHGNTSHDSPSIGGFSYYIKWVLKMHRISSHRYVFFF